VKIPTATARPSSAAALKALQGEKGLPAASSAGCLLRGIDRDAVERGQVLAQLGSTTAHHI
jgi:translation elongation factor EF-Tu-like GTPase